MTPIEAAIQAATNAGTASGFAQALEQTAQNMQLQREQLKLRDGDGQISTYLTECIDALQEESEKRSESAYQLQKVASAAAAAALQDIPDLAKIRAAVAVLLGAG